MPGQKRSHSPSADQNQGNKRQEIDVASHSEDHRRSTSQSSDSPTTLKYKGQHYILFQPWEYDYLNALLFTQKQSISRLRDAGYFILDNPNVDVLQNHFEKEDFTTMPAYDLSQEKLRHAVIDWSFVECQGGTREISHITVLNLINSEEIINCYVWPRTPVTKWDVDCSDKSITEQVLVNASLDGSVLLGWEAARKKLAQHVDAETVLVGQELHNLLKALRISHKNIFDFHIAYKGSTLNYESIRGTPYAQYPNDDYEGCVTADELGDYYELALCLRETAITCLKQPWGAHRILA